MKEQSRAVQQLISDATEAQDHFTLDELEQYTVKRDQIVFTLGGAWSYYRQHELDTLKKLLIERDCVHVWNQFKRLPLLYTTQEAEDQSKKLSPHTYFCIDDHL